MVGYLIVVALLIIFDALWLSFFMADFYKKRLGHIMSEKVHIVSTVPFYLIYALAILVFVVWPSEVYAYTYLSTAFRGAFLGLTAYAAYDFTNQATVKGWSWSLTFIDLLWGAFMTGAISFLVVLG